jgi:hypothetical protein
MEALSALGHPQRLKVKSTSSLRGGVDSRTIKLTSTAPPVHSGSTTLKRKRDDAASSSTAALPPKTGTGDAKGRANPTKAATIGDFDIDAIFSDLKAQKKAAVDKKHAVAVAHQVGVFGCNSL